MSAPPDNDSRLALIFGASGYTGTYLVPALQHAGWRVRASASNRTLLEAREWKGVELVEADALVPSTLAAALVGVEVAYYLVHSLAAGDDHDGREIDAAGNFARAAEVAGVRRIVHLCGLVPLVAKPDGLISPSDVGKRLRSGRVPVTELRANIIIGPGSAAYEVIRDLVHHVPWMLTPAWVQSRVSPIALSNLLHYLVRLPELPETAGGVYEAGGPDYLTYEEMICRFADVIGKSPRILRLPVMAPRFSSYWLGLVTAVPPSIASALIGRLEHDVPANDGAIRALIPQRLLTFTEAVRSALEIEQANAVAARWTEGVATDRAYHSDYALYAKKASNSTVANASPQCIWQVVTSLGGDSGYFYLDEFWRLRELADWLFGGPGLTRGRRDPQRVRVGDAIDYWTVLAVEPGRRLTLDFGLKAPGSGILEFEIEALASKASRITVRAYWHPKGIAGILYWAASAPFHLCIFRGMANAIARRAEGMEAVATGAQ
jgi:uncharacterized protein YbjT (DUF2867 family)